ncbi:MAG TPA: hypothetical protein VFI31_24480, partial [Pirellulales bacterium]|nr:hypothetical protein [Pirellulales bacterium]
MLTITFFNSRKVSIRPEGPIEKTQTSFCATKRNCFTNKDLGYRVSWQLRRARRDWRVLGGGIGAARCAFGSTGRDPPIARERTKKDGMRLR